MNSVTRGTIYEHAVQRHFLETEDVQAVHLWKKVPEPVLYDIGLIGDWNEHRIRRVQKWRNSSYENPFQDTGVDLVATFKDGTYELVQAKAYSNCVNQETLAGFFKHLYLAHLNKRIPGDVKGTIVHSSHVSSVVENFLEDTRGNVRQVELPFQFQEQPPVLEEASYELFPDQQEAVAALCEWTASEKDDPKRGVLSMPCGTGKTVVVGSWLRDSIFDVVVITIPLREHARQMQQRMSKFLPDWNAALVDSDGCRDVEKVRSGVRSGKFLLVCTFQSMDIVRALLPELQGKRWALVIDEFHNLTAADVIDAEDSGSNIQRVLQASPTRVLSVSATPRVFELEGREDDDEEIMGPTIYTLSWQEAIEKKRIADYKLFVPSISEARDFLDDQAKELGLGDLERPLEAQCNFLLKGMLDQGCRRCIVYLPSGPGKQASETAEQYATMLRKLGHEFFGLDVWTASILSDDTSRQRRERLQEFCDGEEATVDGRPLLRFLLSVRILDEAIDLPTCDSVFFARTSGSKLRSVQRLSRAMRLTHPGKIACGFLWCENAYDEHAEMMSGLREIDPHFATKVQVCSGRYSQRDATSTQTALEDDMRVVRNYAIGVEEYKASFLKNYEELRKWTLQNGHARPSQKSSDAHQYRLGKMVDRYRRAFAAKKLAFRYARLLEELPGWSWAPRDDNFMENYKKLCDWASLSGHARPTTTSSDPVERDHALWVISRRFEYNKGRLSEERAKLLSALPKWSWVQKDDEFMEGFLELQEWVSKTGHARPKQSGESRDIGRWVAERRREYKKEKLAPDRIELLSQLPRWSWDVKEDEFKERFFKLREWSLKNEGGKWPSQCAKDPHEKKLGKLINNRRNQYKSSKLTDEQISLFESLPGWSW